MPVTVGGGIPVSKTPGIGTDKPTEVPTFVPSFKPTEPPFEVQTEPPIEEPVPTEPVPPTFNPAEVITIGVVTPIDDDDEVEKVIFSNETDGVINFDPPSEIEARLAEYVLQGGDEFFDRTSYQFAALKRVEAQVGADLMSDTKLIQYYALYSIFEATNAKLNDFIIQSRAFGEGLEGDKVPGWKISSGWLESDLDPCEGEWYGVTCVDDQIINLDLFDNGLTGNFPPEVVLLAGDGFFSTGAGALVSLDIFNNELMSNNGDNSWIQDLGSQLGE
jgi:hypothetical protein